MTDVATQATVWDKARVQNLIATNKGAVVRAIKVLYARQTADEQSIGETRVQNGRGFNSRDANFLTSIAKALPRYNDNMTDKQLRAARKMLPKYWRQLLEEIEEKGGQVNYGVKRVIVDEVEEVDEPELPMDDEPEALPAHIANSDYATL